MDGDRPLPPAAAAAAGVAVAPASTSMCSPVETAAVAAVPALVSVPCCWATGPFSLPLGPAAGVEVPASAPLVLGPASCAAQQTRAVDRSSTVDSRVRQLLMTRMSLRACQAVGTMGASCKH